MANTHAKAGGLTTNDPPQDCAREQSSTPTPPALDSMAPRPLITSHEHDCTGYLGRLPPELRNSIYDMVFQPDIVEEESRVALLDSKPPPKALLSICRQIYQETHKLYQSEYRKFWRESRFFINTRDRYTMLTELEDLNAEDLNNVQHLLMRTKKHSYWSNFEKKVGISWCDYHLLPNQRGWASNYTLDGSVSLSDSMFTYLTKNESQGPYVRHGIDQTDLRAGNYDKYHKEGLPFNYRSIGIKEEMKAIVCIMRGDSRRLVYGQWGDL